jgi:hypothetical protein
VHQNHCGNSGFVGKGQLKNIKRLVTVLFITAITVMATAAQTDLDVRIVDVPEKVAAIDDAIATYKKTERHLYDGDATIFRSDNTVKKIVAEIVLGSGNDRTEWISESYFADGKLIYATDRFDRYDQKEAKDSEAAKAPVRAPQKSYFYKGKLVLFIKGGKAVDWTKPEFDMRERWALGLIESILNPED